MYVQVISSVLNYLCYLTCYQDVVLAKEKKAATQLGVIVGAFILCWMPYFTLFMVVAYYGEVNNALFTTAIWFGYFNSALNPILYPLCNANFKRAFKRMLGMDGLISQVNLDEISPKSDFSSKMDS